MAGQVEDLQALWHQGYWVPVSQQTTNDDGDLRRSVILFREAKSIVARVCFEHYELDGREQGVKGRVIGGRVERGDDRDVVEGSY